MDIDSASQKKRRLGRWLGATVISILVAGITAFAVGIGTHEADKVESAQVIISSSDSRLGAECGFGTYVPEPAAKRLLQAPRPGNWSVVEHEPGAAGFGLVAAQVSIQGESERTVTLTGIKFNVHHSIRPPGAVFEQPCGGPIIGRAIEVNLDTLPPRIIKSSADPNGALGAEQGGRPVTKPVTFPWTVSITDPLLLYIIGATADCYCTWSGELPWVSGEHHGTIMVDNGGKGYTVAGGRLPGHQYINDRWESIDAYEPLPR
jgi:hypothetical protein